MTHRVNRETPLSTGLASDSWRAASDLLVAAIPLALTVLLLISGFTPILRTLSDPYTTWTGFSYQALLNKVMNYALAVQENAASPTALARLREQTLSSLDNTLEYADLRQVEQIGPARLSRAAELFRAAEREPSVALKQARFMLAIQEVQRLNEQAHERIHDIQDLHSRQLERLRLVLLLAAALSGLLSAALIWRSLRLWRTERQRLDGQRELLSLASHELRRPLQSLLLATDLLRVAQSAEDRLRYLGVVESSAGLLASRANLEHLDTMYGEVHLDWQPVDLVPLLREFEGPRTEVLVPLASLTVLADAARLRQIIENLHENALRYSPGKVGVELQLPGGQPEVWVRDNGPGIDPADVERLFLPRERSDTQVQPSAPGQGLGLGLTIARRLAEAHGADLTLTKAPGGGTLAVLRLQALTHAPQLQTEPVSGRQKRLR